MKLAISNIGWTNEEEPQIAELLRSLGVRYIEIAPTKTWDEPINVSAEDAREYVDWWASFGIEVVAFQSMLFSHPEYKIFETDEERKVTQDYLKSFVALAGAMGAKRMVFGSPKNRQRGDVVYDEALDIATTFFSAIADTATEEGVVFCIEPNAPQYHCDFVSNSAEGLEIVQRVNKVGFGLHLDIACMTLAGDSIATSIKNAKEYLKHFHISSPMLEQVEDRDDMHHAEAAQALKEIGYDGFISIEMRPGESGSNANRVQRAVEFAQKIYN